LPNFQSAKQISENALTQIGAFPASMSQADEGELKRTLKWLEMLLNLQTGVRPMAGFFRVIEIPLEANVGDYSLGDYADQGETQHVFSVSLVNHTGDVNPLDLLWESDAVNENLSQTGGPSRVMVSKDAVPTLSVYPMPVQSNQDAGQVLRVRIQTYHPSIDGNGTGNEELFIRPSWYLWLTKRLAYEIGCGPVRRLAEGELKRLQDDAADIEGLLEARDGQFQSPQPPTTDPMVGWDSSNNCGRYNGGYRPR